MGRQRRACSYRSSSIRRRATDAGADRARYNEVEPSTKEGPLMTREGRQGLGGRRVWFVTGASRGFGLEIVRQVLERGEAVVATARDPRRMEEGLAGGGARSR